MAGELPHAAGPVDHVHGEGGARHRSHQRGLQQHALSAGQRWTTIIILNILLLLTAGVRVLPLLRQVHLALVQGDAQGWSDRQPVQAGRGRRRQQAQDSVLSSLQGGE